jgi:hypothetical protein
MVRQDGGAALKQTFLGKPEKHILAEQTEHWIGGDARRARADEKRIVKSSTSAGACPFPQP